MENELRYLSECREECDATGPPLYGSQIYYGIVKRIEWLRKQLEY